jgi:hypothetical protein
VPVDSRGSREPDSSVVERRATLAEVPHIERHGSCDASDGQITRDPVLVARHRLDLRAAKVNRRMALDVEKVLGSQVIVALGLT